MSSLSRSGSVLVKRALCIAATTMPTIAAEILSGSAVICIQVMQNVPALLQNKRRLLSLHESTQVPGYSIYDWLARDRTAVHA
jgi:hypothetical protein